MANISPIIENTFPERIYGYLPTQWFSDENPILMGYLAGPGILFFFIYNLLIEIKNQTRLQTSTGEFIDLWAQDFFGTDVQRCYGESDEAYIKTIENNILAPRVTRQAMITNLYNLTGRIPIIWENQSQEDGAFLNHAFLNHAYLSGSFTSGAYQAWIIAFRPTPLVSNRHNFLNNDAFCNADSYFGPDLFEPNCVTDDLILKTINETKPAGTLMHVTILD